VQHRGFVEVVSEDVVGGWCWDPAHPESHLEVDICLDGEILISVTACKERADLARSAIGDGRHGFRVTLPRKLSEDDQWKVVAKARSVHGSTILPRVARPPEMPAPARLSAATRRVARCIVHIGTEKTGSTSLQAFLGKQRKELLARGILVPLSLSLPHPNGAINHTELVSYSHDISTLNAARFHEAEAPLTPHDMKAYRLARESSLRDEINQTIAAAPFDVHTILVSCELLHNRLLLREELERLRNLLNSLADKLEILVYLRPQHEVAVSLYSTALKNGSVDRRILPNTQGTSADLARIKRIYEFDELVTRWEAVFGPGSVYVRLYCSDVVADFRQLLSSRFQCGLDVHALHNPAARHNTNLSASAQRVLLALNDALARMPNHEAKLLRDRILGVLMKCFPGSSALPARGDAETFQAFFEESNSRLCARVFPQRERLFELDFSKYPEVATPLQATNAEMSEIILKLLRRDDPPALARTGP
jgi:hypothetical protein